MNESALPAQLQARLVAVLSECHQLQGTEDPEEQPYKSLYAAADLLETLINELQAAQTQQQEAGSADQLLLLAEACAWARCLRGIVLLQTDLLHDGEADLTAGLGHPWSDSCYSHALRSRALNALGALCQERSKHTEAQQHLEAALAHYQAAKSGPWAAGRPASASAPQEATSSSSSSGDATLANNSSPDGDGATNNPAATTPSSSSTSSVNSALEQLHAAMASASGMTPAYLEQHHSLTLVTLAQVAAAQGQAAASASYCAAGLNSYLATGTYAAQLDEWVQNCLQLGAYYTDTRTWGAAAYCQAAVAALLARHGIDPAAVVAACVEEEEQQEGGSKAATQQQQQERGASPDASPVSGSDQQQGSSSSSSSGRPHQGSVAGSQGPDAAVTADTSQQPCSTSKEQQLSTGDVSTSACGGSSTQPAYPQLRLSPDVAANVLLARGKLLMARLAASHGVVVEGRPREEAARDVAQGLPAELSFTGLADAVPQHGILPAGTTALVGDYPGALGLAQAALRAFRGAAAYYRLDGWVTEHVRLLFDMSNVYRLLAGFEPDPHRACVTHRHRAKLLGPLEGQLSLVHFLGLVRSLHLELGNVARSIHEIKEAAGWPAAKVAAAGREAALQYQRFLDTYAPPGAPKPAEFTTAAAGAGGAGLVWEVPEGLEGEDQEAYLRACFSLGRVLHKCSAAEGDVAPLLASLARLRGAAAYVRRHGLSEWEREAALAGELADLVAAKVDMTRRLAAMRAAGVAAGKGGQLAAA